MENTSHGIKTVHMIPISTIHKLGNTASNESQSNWIEVVWLKSPVGIFRLKQARYCEKALR